MIGLGRVVCVGVTAGLESAVSQVTGLVGMDDASCWAGAILTHLLTFI